MNGKNPSDFPFAVPNFHFERFSLEMSSENDSISTVRDNSIPLLNGNETERTMKT